MRQKHFFKFTFCLSTYSFICKLKTKEPDIEKTNQRPVGFRVLRNLSGGSINLFTDDGPSILLADQLNPSVVTSFQDEEILAICTAKGTATSHSAILSRNLGIPVLFGLGEQRQII